MKKYEEMSWSKSHSSYSMLLLFPLQQAFRHERLPQAAYLGRDAGGVQVELALDAAHIPKKPEQLHGVSMSLRFMRPGWEFLTDPLSLVWPRQGQVGIPWAKDWRKGPRCGRSGHAADEGMPQLIIRRKIFSSWKEVLAFQLAFQSRAALGLLNASIHVSFKTYYDYLMTIYKQHPYSGVASPKGLLGRS